MKARIALVAAIALLAPAAFVASIVASPASGVAPTLLARGTYEPFKESAVRDSPVEFKAKTNRRSTSSSAGTTTRSVDDRLAHASRSRVHHRDAGSVDVLPL